MDNDDYYDDGDGGDDYYECENDDEYNFDEYEDLE